MGSLWTTTLCDANHSWYKKTYLVTRDIKLGLHLPCYLTTSFRSTSHMYLLWETFTVLGFHMNTQMIHSFSSLYLYVFIHFPSFSSLSLFDPLIPVPPSIHNCLFYLLFLGRSSTLLQPFTLYLSSVIILIIACLSRIKSYHPHRLSAYHICPPWSGLLHKVCLFFLVPFIYLQTLFCKNWVTIHCANISYFFHLYFDEHLVCFQFLANINKTVMNMVEQESL